MYTLADLVLKTGVKRRALQFWAEAGILQAQPGTDRAGTGVHRLYSDYELFIAACMVPLARMRVSVGMLLKAANAIRELPHRDDPSAIRLAVSHDGSAVTAGWFDGTAQQWTVDVARLSASGMLVHIMPMVPRSVARIAA